MFSQVVAAICIGWYIFIACVCSIGYVCLFLYYHQNPPKAAALSLEPKEEIPYVTLIRPCKGLEPYLYECLASTFQQDYPREKIAVHFCVFSRADPAYPIIVRVVQNNPEHNARVFIQEDDDSLDNGDEEESRYRRLLGPNPKIRNMSKAYREAGKNDLIWIIDCNVWVGHGVCGRMVDKLCGYTPQGQPSVTPYKLVHHLPISVDVDAYDGSNSQVTRTSSYDIGESATASPASHATSSPPTTISQYGGGRLEELFLSSAHAKMYVAINTVAIAPCIVGKSTMFRRSHLDYLTSQKTLQERKFDPSSEKAPLKASTGIDYFSHNICEDHLIGDLLWKSRLPPLATFPHKMRNHGLVFGDLAIQPISAMSVGNYISRRVRWLRVRKFTVPVATLVEPGTESFLCSAMGAWGITTLGATRWWAGHTWTALLCWWTISIFVWVCVDWTVFLLLQSGRTVKASPLTTTSTSQIPAFVKPLSTDLNARRKFTTWLLAWLGRESLTLPIWTWAIWGGMSVTWREGRYWVGLDMRVHEIRPGKTEAIGERERMGMEDMNGHTKDKAANGHLSNRGKERIA